MNNHSTIKANLATIELGDIKLDVYQLPDGSYRMSLTQVFLAVSPDYDPSQAAKRNVQIQTSKQALTLVPQGFQNIQSLKIEGVKNTVKSMSMSDVGLFWTICAVMGMQDAFKLVAACTTEALERRADKAFDVIISELERNSRFKARVEGKVTRREWSNSVDDYIYRHINDGRCSQKYIKYIYSNCTNYLYRKVLGHSARNAKILFQIEQTDSLRDQLSERVLKELDHIENLAMRYVDEDDLEPLAAMKLACEVGKVKHIGLSDC